MYIPTILTYSQPAIEQDGTVNPFTADARVSQVSGGMYRADCQLGATGTWPTSDEARAALAAQLRDLADFIDGDDAKAAAALTDAARKKQADAALDAKQAAAAQPAEVKA